MYVGPPCFERIEFMNTQNGTKKALNKINRTQKKEKRKFMTERRNMGPFWIIVIPVQVIFFLNNCIHSRICGRILVFFKGGNLFIFKVGFYKSKINKTCSWGVFNRKSSISWNICVFLNCYRRISNSLGWTKFLRAKEKPGKLFL